MKPLDAALSPARAHGLTVDEHVVPRDLSNLLVHLRPAPVVARGAPVVAPAAESAPPRRLGDHVLAPRRPRSGTRPAGADVGAALRVLHEELEPYPGELPGLDQMLDEVERFIERLLLGTSSGPLWTDLEDTCRGPVEWDLACLVTSARVLGLEQERSAEALAAYGRDPDDPSLEPFIDARALQTATWTAFMAERHPQLHEGARLRLDALPS